MNKHQPFGYASDYVPDSEVVDNDPIPMMTPFQRYILDGMRGISADVKKLKVSVDAMTPRIHELEKKAALWGKATNIAKYLAPVLLLELAKAVPSVAKYVPIITDAINKANL